MTTGVYCILCLKTDEAYVGTGIDWQQRVARHVSRLIRGVHKNQKMQTAWSNFGQPNFAFRLLEGCSKGQLLERERFWAKKLGSITHGFNSGKLGSNGNLIHGLVNSRTHKSWESMKQRCLNPRSPDYSRYGAKGVLICDQWHSFENFLADMGERPQGTSLDRYPDKNGNYEPRNCRWATPSEQQRNLRNNQYLTYKGQTKLLVDWATEIGIPVDLLRQRLNKGVVEGALFAPSYSRFAGLVDDTGHMPKRYRHESDNVQRFAAFGRELTLTEWARELNVERSLLAQRVLRRGIPLEKALVSMHLKKGKEGPRDGHKMLTAFGKTQSLTAWSRETEIAVTTLKNRIQHARMSIEEALMAPLYAQQRTPRKERNQ